MNFFRSSRLAAAALALLATAVRAQQECPKPGLRQLSQMQVAISQDESMAQSFEVAASACATESAACDDARARCGGQLTQTLQRQISFDEGAFLRDMLIAYQGQQYRMATPIPSAPALTDVSCNADSPVLQAAGSRRRAQAERRKLMLAEYPRWQVWIQQQYQLCLDRAAAEKVRIDAQTADANKLLAAAEAAKRAEQLKQDTARAAEKAAKEKAEAEAKLAKEKASAEAKAKEEQEREQRAAQAEAKRLRGAAEADALAKAEAEKKANAERLEKEQQARESAAETAARKQKEAEEAAIRKQKDAEEVAAKKQREAEEARVVAEREAKKENARLRQAELIEKERAREDDVKLQHERARQAAEIAHEKKIEALKRDLALTEAEKATQLADADQQYRENEEKRKAAAAKEIDSAGHIDHSDERMIGALSGHASAGYYSLKTASAPLVGGQITIRHGFWATAPAAGMASGVELRATGLFLAAVSTGTSAFIQAAGEFRYWFGRFGLGAAFEFQYFIANQNILGLGLTLSLAGVDSPDARIFFTARWLPLLNNHFDRITGEIEGGYGLFSFAVQGGVLKDTANAGPTPSLGWFVGASLGARLRW